MPLCPYRSRTAIRRAPVLEVYPPDHIREYTERSLENFGLDAIDLQQFLVWDDAWAVDDG